MLSFRGSSSQLDPEIIKLAQSIHGGLVPLVKDHGIMEGSDPPLYIYTMPLLPGAACLEMLSYQALEPKWILVKKLRICGSQSILLGEKSSQVIQTV